MSVSSITRGKRGQGVTATGGRGIPLPSHFGFGGRGKRMISDKENSHTLHTTLDSQIEQETMMSLAWFS